MQGSRSGKRIGGGANKEDRVKTATEKYLKITKTFRNKLECSKGNIPTETESDASMFKELEDGIVKLK